MNLNAAIDKTITVKSFQLGKIHRPDTVKALPGGKGCNVARALNQLGATPVVSGWVGGTAGQFIESGLHKEGIHTDFIHTDSESRTCLSILDTENQLLTEIYEKGETVSAEKIEEMKLHFRVIVGQYDAVTLSGSLPTGVPPDFYYQLIAIASEYRVPCFLDSSKDALKIGVEAKPYLIKPNEEEITILVNRMLNEIVDYAGAAAEISTQYKTIVVLSMGKNGALAANGLDVIYVQNPNVDARSAVGSGDSLLAGLVYGLTRDFTMEQSLVYGVAAGTANTLKLGAGQFTIADFEQVKDQVIVKKVNIV